MEKERRHATNFLGIETPPPSVGWRIGGATLLLVGLVATALALHQLKTRGSSSEAIWLWLFALAVLPVGLNFGVRDPLHLARPRADAELGTVLGILVLAMVLQIAVLPESQGPNQPSETELSSILRGDVQNLFAPGSSGFPPLSCWAAIPLAPAVGGAAPALRWGATIEGLISVLLFYLVARRIFPFRVAAVAALLLTLTPWHIQLTRIGIVEPDALVGPLLLFYLLLRAVDSGRPIEYLLSGYSAGLCMAFSRASLVGPVAALLYLLFRAVREPGFLRLHGGKLLLLAAGTLVFMSPFRA